MWGKEKVLIFFPSLDRREGLRGGWMQRSVVDILLMRL